MGIPQDTEDKGLKGKASIPTDDFPPCEALQKSLFSDSLGSHCLFPLMKRSSNSVAKFPSLVRARDLSKADQHLCCSLLR